MGPYFPPDITGRPPAPVYPPQPGLLLLTAALALIVALIAREIVRRRRTGGERMVDDLTIIWMPAEAVEMAHAVEEELSFGPLGRPHRPGRRAMPS
jgi:hypothetical protein